TTVSMALDPDFPLTSGFSFATGDFNHDGNPDVAVATVILNQWGVNVYLGNGDGTFQAPIRLNPGAEFTGLVVGDFNNDGKLDLAAARPFLCFGCGGAPAYQLYVFLGTGDGHFTATASSGAQAGLPIFAADFNRDGGLDLIVTSSSYDAQDWY